MSLQFIILLKTNRCVVVDESGHLPVSVLMCVIFSSNCFDYLDAPVELISSEDVPMPYNHRLELAVQPSVKKVIDAVRKVSYIS